MTVLYDSVSAAMFEPFRRRRKEEVRSLGFNPEYAVVHSLFYGYFTQPYISVKSGQLQDNLWECANSTPVSLLIGFPAHPLY